jgi:ATP-binding cassette, subfamily C (CFTR/MRP), member 1
MILSEDELDVFIVQYVSVGIRISTFILAGAIQFYHKKKGYPNSGLLFMFWFLLSICSTAQLRWEVINYRDDNFTPEINSNGFQFINFTTFFALISLMTILNCFCDKMPRNSSYPKFSNPSPELRASALNRIFFGWIDSTILKGYRRALTERDIFSINPQNTSAEVAPVFEKFFKKTLEIEKR